MIADSGSSRRARSLSAIASFEAALEAQKFRVPVMGGGVVRVELDRAPESALGRRPVPVVVLEDQGQGGVGLGQAVVELERPEGRGAGRSE